MTRAFRILPLGDKDETDACERGTTKATAAERSTQTKLPKVRLQLPKTKAGTFYIPG